MFVDHVEDQLVHPEVFGLNTKAFLQRATCNTHRIELLNYLQNLLCVLRIQTRFLGETGHHIFRGNVLKLQVAIVTEVSHNQRGEPLLIVDEVAQSQLPHDVVGQSSDLESVASIPGSSSSAPPPR